MLAPTCGACSRPVVALPWAAWLLGLLAVSADARGQSTSTADSLFRRVDVSGDGVLTMSEATPASRTFLERIFKEAGKAATESVSRDEFRAAYERLHSKPDTGDTSKASPGGEPAAVGSGEPPAGLQYIDTDADDAISRSEWSKFTQAFHRLDVDKDGGLSAEELAATGGAAELLAELADTNADGKVLRAEWARLAQRFARVDTNRDGALDEAELKKAAEAAVAAASGKASLPAGGSKSAISKGPTLWRGQIEGRSRIELLITGNRIEGRELGGRGENLGTGTFTMTGDGKSGNMDAVYTEGPRSGETCLGIYRLEGNTLTWCVNNRGGRPQDFSGGRGSWLLTLTLVDDAPRQ